MTDSAFRGRRPENITARLTTAAAGLTFLFACTPPPPVPAPEPPAATWNVTTWGRLYEVFPEVDALAAGELATAHTHVTVLDDFSPLTEGSVEIILRGNGNETVFRATEPGRPGIFAVELRPETAGEFDLFFRLSSTHGDEEIRGGRVRVGTPEDPGIVTVAPAPRGATDGGEPLPFLKEEQWRTEFATAWARGGSLPRAVEGLARVRPAAGGDVSVTAPVDAVLRAEPWPYPGQRLRKGTALVRLVPRIAADESLAVLAADEAVHAAELAGAEARLARLEELLTLEAISRQEVEDARTRRAVLDERRRAAAEDLEAARAARQGGDAGAVTLTAPWSGEIAAVLASPGAAVQTGEPLVRLVRTAPLWLDVAVTPEDARRVAADGLAGLVAHLTDGTVLRPDADDIRLVSIAPEVDRETGMVTVLVELSSASELVIGTVVDAQLLLAEEVAGIVVPASAVVDDSGVSVAYLQLSGERFARQPVRVAARQGDRVLLDGLVPGQRVVLRGGEAIRRSSLMSSGSAHGHVH